MPRFVLAFASPGYSASLASGAAEPAIDFDREIRPILSENCFKCHGPDEHAAQGRAPARRRATRRRCQRRTRHRPRQARRERADRAHHSAPKPATHAAARERTRSSPPRRSTLLQRWIEQGANYAQHWSFVPPKRPPLPAGQQDRALGAQRRSTASSSPGSSGRAAALARGRPRRR